jgi:nitrite reductase (NADH) large subunit
VIIAAGVRPNSHLARQSGLKVHNGVVVDDTMFTSDPAILAAGDVAEHLGRLYGIWPAGFAQGVIAGTNAVGGRAEFSELAPSNRLKVLDIDLFSIGRIQPEDASTQIHEDERDGAYRALFSRDGQLVGAVLYGDTKAAGLLKEVVETRRQISEVPELRDIFR